MNSDLDTGHTNMQIMVFHCKINIICRTFEKCSQILTFFKCRPICETFILTPFFGLYFYKIVHSDTVEHKVMGAFINDVMQIWTVFNPPPPLAHPYVLSLMP